MDLISFDALRSFRLPGARYIKPEHLYHHLDRIRRADGVIFPQYWQLNPLIYALNRRIFPSAATYLIGHDKVEMTRCFQIVAPDHVPDTQILANSDSNADLLWDRMARPFVAKVPRSSMGQGVFLIDNLQQWRAYRALSPVLYVQEYLPIDRDLRIIWIGDQIIGGYWRTQAPQGFYNNVAQGGAIEQGLIPLEARLLVERLATTLGIDHGGFDVAMVGAHPYVFEFNRLFGNQGLRDSAIDSDALIGQYLQRRWGNPYPELPDRPLPEAV